jgi:DNA-binding NarL/FixJ family response regulator
VIRVFRVHSSTSLPAPTVGGKKREHWTQEDTDVLIAARNSGSTLREIIIRHFPLRTLRSVRAKAEVVCPAGQQVIWSEEDTLKLITSRERGDSFSKIQAEHFPDRDVEKCRGKYTRFTRPRAVSAPASRRVPRHPWTAHDDEQVMLSRNQGKTADEIQSLAYPKLSVTTVRRNISRLHAIQHPGIPKHKLNKLLSKEEKLHLQELHVRDGLAVRDISVILNRCDSTVRLTLETMGLKPHRPKQIRKPWSEEDLEQLKPYLGQRLSHEQCRALARRLARTIQSVHMRIALLRKGTSQSRSYKKKTWTAEDCLSLDNMYAQGLPWAEIAEKFNCTVTTVQSRLMYRNLRRPESERPKRIKRP